MVEIWFDIEIHSMILYWFPLKFMITNISDIIELLSYIVLKIFCKKLAIKSVASASQQFDSRSSWAVAIFFSR